MTRLDRMSACLCAVGVGLVLADAADRMPVFVVRNWVLAAHGGPTPGLQSWFWAIPLPLLLIVAGVVASCCLFAAVSVGRQVAVCYCAVGVLLHARTLWVNAHDYDFLVVLYRGPETYVPLHLFRHIVTPAACLLVFAVGLGLLLAAARRQTTGGQSHAVFSGDQAFRTTARAGLATAALWTVGYPLTGMRLSGLVYAAFALALLAVSTGAVARAIVRDVVRKDDRQTT